jgi:hypothetical protein
MARNRDRATARVGEAAQFLREVVIPFKRTDCLLWPYAKSTAGYAQIRMHGVTHYVYRIVCEAQHGKAPPKQEARHLCGAGNLGCVNPKHVVWGTRRQNQLDRVAHGTSNRGERQWQAKLTAKDITKIRSSKLLQREIAAQYGITQSQVSRIVNHQDWRHVK